MNGFAGSSRPRNRKQELIGSNGAVPTSKTESGDPVVGLAVRIVESQVRLNSMRLVPVHPFVRVRLRTKGRIFYRGKRNSRPRFALRECGAEHIIVFL